MGKEKQQDVLEVVKEILKETNQKFKKLQIEAEIAFASMNFDVKLKEKAQLLIDLPGRLSPFLDKLKPEIRLKIGETAGSFAANAEKALTAPTSFPLEVLLIDYGSQEGDKNRLEKLIKSLD